MFAFPHSTQLARRLFCLSLVVLGLFTSIRPCAAEDSEPLENRFLIIIETSASMSRSSDAVQSAIANILGSDIQGQLRPGDTVGIWTYSDQLNTDFPMQVWSAAQKKPILDSVSTYLHSVRYAKKGRLDRVWPSMISVMKSSRTLTVFFIYDGAEPIKGTRFDNEINDLQKDYQQELRSANLPFVTVLAARNGDFFEYTVNSPSSTIRVPQTAEPEKKPDLAAVKPTNAPPVKPREIRRFVIAPPGEAATSNVAQKSNTAGPIKVQPAPTPLPAPAPVPLPAPAPLPTPPRLSAPVLPPAPAPQPALPIISNPPAAALAAPISVPTNTPATVEPAHFDPPSQPAAIEPPKPEVATPEKPAEMAPEPPALPTPASKNPMLIPLTIACGLLVLAIGIIVYLVRYLVRKDQPSLISQSMRRKPGQD